MTQGFGPEHLEGWAWPLLRWRRWGAPWGGVGEGIGEEFQDPSVGHRGPESGVVGTVMSQTLSPLCRDEFRL